MKRILFLVPALLMAAPAVAQTAPEASYKDLWCGLAFGSVTAAMPPLDATLLAAARAAGDAATEEQKAMVGQDDQVSMISEGGTGLVDRATTAYKDAGFTDEQFATAKSELAAKVESQVATGGSEAEFSFEDCISLLPQPAMSETGTESAPATTPETTTETTPEATPAQ